MCLTGKCRHPLNESARLLLESTKWWARRDSNPAFQGFETLSNHWSSDEARNWVTSRKPPNSVRPKRSQTGGGFGGLAPGTACSKSDRALKQPTISALTFNSLTTKNHRPHPSGVLLFYCNLQPFLVWGVLSKPFSAIIELILSFLSVAIWAEYQGLALPS
jgi:hypothetical protein